MQKIEDEKDSLYKIQVQQVEQLKEKDSKLQELNIKITAQDQLLQELKECPGIRDDYKLKLDNCIDTGRKFKQEHIKLQTKFDATSIKERVCATDIKALGQKYTELQTSIKTLSEDCKEYMDNRVELQRVLRSNKMSIKEAEYYNMRLQKEREMLQQDLREMDDQLKILQSNLEASLKKEQLTSEEKEDVNKELAKLTLIYRKLKKDKTALDE